MFYYNVIYESPDEPLTEEVALIRQLLFPMPLMDDSTAKVLENSLNLWRAYNLY